MQAAEATFPVIIRILETTGLKVVVVTCSYSQTQGHGA